MKYKNKVLAYIYRFNKGQQEVLVFDHDNSRDDPLVNPQVPAGTIEENESPETAVLREVIEETGLEFNQFEKYLGAFDYKHETLGKSHRRHLFEFHASGLEDSWTHKVSSGDEDEGMLFYFYWLPLAEAKEKLVARMGEHLPLNQSIPPVG